MRENVVLAEIREAIGKIARVQKNVKGTGRFVGTGEGQKIQYGLLFAGSSDLIGWLPVILNGKRIAVFVAFEVKAPGARTEKEHLSRQENFCSQVRAAGGVAGIVNSRDVAIAIIDDYLEEIGATLAPYRKP